MWDATEPMQRLLCLIGDPKQAIYRFRGGDIETYRRAVLTVAQRPEQRDDPPLFDLTDNRRSTPLLLHALETLFEMNADPFRGAGIDFKRVQAAGRARDDALRSGGAAAKALTVHWLPQLEPDESAHHSSSARKGFRKSEHERELMVQVAVNIVAERLANDTLSGESLLPKQVAVLTNTNKEAARMRTALARAGIAAALLSRDSVFESEAAHELRIVLHAIAEQDNPGLLRAALATPLLGLDAAALAAPDTGQAQLLTGTKALEAAAERWRSRGPLVALMPLLSAAAERWLGERDGARRLTDTLHLCELLQAEAALRPTPAEVLRWFEQRMREGGEVEAEQLRLEADAGMVLVTTVHKAKGLEYPVVILPFAALRSEGRKTRLRTVEFQPPQECVDETSRLPVRAWLQEGALELPDLPLADAAKGPRDIVLAWEEREALQEEQRKLYVALTRAQYALHVVWSRNDYTDGTALHWLLHGERKIGMKEGLLLAQHMREQLDTLASRAPHAIAIRDVDPQADAAALPRHVAEAHRRSRAVQAQPQARIAQRGLGIDPRLHSFSSLHARSEQAEAERGAADELPVPVEREDGADALSGSGFGNVVHAVLEAAEFAQWAPALSTPADGGAASAHRRRAAATAAGQRELFAAAAPDAPREDPDAIPPAQAGLIERALRREGIAPTPAHAAQTARLVRRALCVPLPGGVVLHALPQTSLVRELGFHFRLRPTRLDALYALLDAHGYPRHRRAPAATLAGYMHGYIDLIYRDDAGRHYVLDYKTNRLPAYDTASLRQSVARQDYDLQYLIYLVALRRWLRLRRGPAFDAAQEIGGAVYLFLRGISLHAPAGDDDGTAGRDGVHVDAVAPELLAALDALFDGVPGAAEHSHAGATA
jgi:exodeoxyribonuclease V beta subunit